LAAVAAFGQQPPVITDGPVNAGSYTPMGLPNGGIAQGSMFILKGTNLGQCGTFVANRYPLQTAMNGTSVRVTVGSTTLNAFMTYVVACRGGNLTDQIAAVLPSNTPIGNGSVVIAFNNRPSASVPIRVVRASFGIFTRNEAGTGPAIVENFIAQGNTPVNGLTIAAKPGQTVVLWGTGLGPVSGNEASGPLPGDFGPGNVEVGIGVRTAEISYRGRSGCCAGIDQISFAVPTGFTGCYVPVFVRVDGIVSNVATMSITENGTTCNDPTGFTASELARMDQPGPLVMGSINLSRLRININVPGVVSASGIVDSPDATFFNYSAGEIFRRSIGPAIGLDGGPSPGSVGTCVVRAFQFNPDDGPFEAAFTDGPEPKPIGLDAGSALTFAGPTQTKTLDRLADGQSVEYSADGIWAGGIPLPGFGPPTPTVFDTGTTTVSNGTGGTKIGAFRASVNMPAPSITWTNASSLTTLQRNQPLTVTWSGGAPGQYVVMTVSSASADIRAGARLFCIEKATAGSFTISPLFLQNLPASGVVSGVPVGFLGVGTYLPSAVRFAAPGSDINVLNYLLLDLKNVVFQ
jgi:uncharacterized protein (TIGR03437 family)